MPQYYKLNTGHLSLFTNEIIVPRYDRSRLKTGIVHLGADHLFRCHAAVFTDDVLNDPSQDEWGICLAGMYEKERRVIEAIETQDGFYTILVTPPGATLTGRIIGSVKECIFTPDAVNLLVSKMSSPDTKIISLDVPLEDSTEPDPLDVFSVLAKALRKRRDERLPGLTVLSLVDIPRNGEKTRMHLLSFLKKSDPGLIPWIENEVTFPNSVVDRISPETTLKDKENLKAVFSVDDAVPVVTEPFKQWILEDHFKAGRPAWEKTGVMLTRDSSPYERMKTGLVNGGHILLAMLGTLEDCLTTDDAMAVPLVRQMLSRYIDQEVIPILGSVVGIDLKEYREIILRRFANSALHDPLSSICVDSKALLLSALVPVIRENLDKGGPIKVASLTVAAWYRYLELAGMIEESDPAEFLKKRSGFKDIAGNERFLATFLSLMDALRKFGSEVTMRYLDQFVPGE